MWGAASRRTLCTLEAELGLRRGMTKELAKRRRETQEAPTKKLGPVARVSTARLRKDSAAALSAEYSTDARALYEQCPGFVGSILLLNDDGTSARSVTLWQSESHMDAAGKQRGYSTTMGSLARHFAGAPESETWSLGAAFFSAEQPAIVAHGAAETGEAK